MTADQIEMRRRVQRALTWTGPIMLIVWIGAFIVLARMIPPPSPGRSAEQVVAALSNDTTAFRAGVVITMFASALLVPFAAVISAHIRRIEGYGSGPLATTQVISAALLSLEFIVPLIVWLAASYRLEETDAETVRMFNDLAWLLFVVVVASVEVQILAIAAAILTDRRPDPIFPRWAAYLNLWVAAGLTPAACVVFFKDGPLAWNGVLGFYVPLTSFAIWLFAMFVLLRRAIDDEASETSEDPSPDFSAHAIGSSATTLGARDHETMR